MSLAARTAGRIWGVDVTKPRARRRTRQEMP
jgi:hypothetical protein